MHIKGLIKFSKKKGVSAFFYLFFFAALKGYSEKNNTSGFIENKGQIVDQNYKTNTDVLFLYTGKGIKVQLRKTGYSYEVYNLENFPSVKGNKKFQGNPSEFLKAAINSYRVDLDFAGMNSNVQISAEEMSAGRLNYFINGNPVSDVRSFQKIIYKNVYDNTDIEFLINETSSAFKYNIILHPGADIHKIQVLCKGANAIYRTENGSIKIKTPLGEINETIPLSYYLDVPTQNKIVNFNIKNNIISFSSSYDNAKTFVIDPSTNRIWGTYYGDAAVDYCNATGTDAAGNVYIAGYSASTSNIATSGTYQNSLLGSVDIYLAKFNSNGVRLWGTYFGGSSFDVAFGIHVTSYGVVYICGDTNSPANIATVGAHQTVYGGGIDDAILTKFNTNGQLIWATYYGGLQHDFAPAVAVDASKNVILGGHTESNNGIATVSAYNNTFSFNSDAFIAKFDSLGVRQWGTYYGDTGYEEVWGAACDASNNVYVTGFSSSLFGISAGAAHQGINGGGGQDAFISKFDPSGTNLIWGSYYGGTGSEQGSVLRIDNANNIFLGGYTSSPNNIASASSHQTAIGSSDDGFVARFNTSGVRQWGTYYGGNDVDYVFDLVLDPVKSNIYFCGSTESINGISTITAYQNNLSSANFYDAYFAKFSYSGVRQLATYYGGTDNDAAKGITRDNTGKVYICGTTTSTNGIASTGSHMSVAGGADDGFLAKFCAAELPLITPAATTTICAGTSYSLSTQSGFTSYLWSNGSTSYSTSVSTATVATYYFTVMQFDSFGCDAISDSVKIVVDLCLAIQELEKDNLVNIYPNPAQDILFMEFKTFNNESIDVEIYSAQGQLLSKTGTNESNFKYDTKNLPSGIYFLRVRSENKIIEKKFIIQN